MLKSSYPKHAVGEHIVSFPLVFHKDTTVTHALSVVEEKRGAWPNSEYLYVTELDGKLIGTIPFKKLISAKRTQTLGDIMEVHFSAVTDHTHQENAAKLAVTKDLETIPVTDVRGHFLGILDAKQIFKILHEIHVEKLMHFSGVLDSKELTGGYKTNYLTSVFTRIPSLIIGLFGGFLSIAIIEQFEVTLQKELTLAFFIPVMVYMNAAVGTQIQTIFVRFSSFEKINIVKAFFHELKVVLVIGFILSLIMFLFPYFWHEDIQIAFVVAISMFLGIISSVIIGMFVPWSLQKSGYDPAIGSGPFTTIIQDLLSILIYFSIATLLL
jgi:magnesium transporter